jgi:hypothetical protein
MAALAMLWVGCPPAPVSPPRPWTSRAPDAGVIPSAPATGSTTAARTGISDECRERVGGFRAWLAAVESAGNPLSTSLLDQSRLVERSGPAIDEPGPVVQLTAAALYLDGVKLDDPRALGEQLEKLIELRKQVLEGSPFIGEPFCYLAIDAEVPWSEVTALVERAGAAGMRRVFFVFADPERRVEPPPPSPIDDDLVKMNEASLAKRQQLLVELLAYVYKDCPDALPVIAQLGHEVADLKDAILSELPNAIEACDCATNDASMRALHWALFGNPRPVAGYGVRLATVDTPARTVVTKAPTAIWNEASGALASLADEQQPVAVAVAAPKPR